MVGMAVSWAVPWSIVIGITGGLLVYFLPPYPQGVSRTAVALQAVLAYGLNGAVIGFLTGSVFSMVLMAAERKQELSALKQSRFALWGAVAGAVPSLAMVLPALAGGYTSLIAGTVIVAVAVGLGASSAAASLRIAKSGLAPGPAPSSRDELALPESE